MSDTSRSNRPKASFGTPKVNALGVLARAKIMYAAILAAVASFPNPTVAMAAFLVLIQALDAAQQAATSRAKGLATIRNTKRDLVWTAMESLRIYVQGLADIVTPENAAALIELAGLLVAPKATHQKPILQAKLTTTSGVVHVFANAKLLLGGKKSKSVTFNWAWSSDGGKTWNTVPSTPLADTLIPNLTPQTQYQFRVCVTVSRVTGAWTDAVAIWVH